GHKVAIKTDALDFAERPEDFNTVVSVIERELFGLFA
ncbi:MAG: deoxynucleoside kinase, partial [Rhizobacter sp.]|nr:deoxynucleoside kinase [Chlorobiales bacterium]